MNNINLVKFNTKTYLESHIYFHANKGYTSKLAQRLISQGYRFTKSGSMYYVYDANGIKIIKAWSHLQRLEKLSTFFR